MRLNATLAAVFLLGHGALWAQKSLNAFNRFQGNPQLKVSDGFNRFNQFQQFNRNKPVQQRQAYNRMPNNQQRQPQYNAYNNQYNAARFQAQPQQQRYRTLPIVQPTYNSYTPNAWQQRVYNTIPSWYTGGIGQNRVGMQPAQRGGRINLR